MSDYIETGREDLQVESNLPKLGPFDLETAALERTSRHDLHKYEFIDDSEVRHQGQTRVNYYPGWSLEVWEEAPQKEHVLVLGCEYGIHRPYKQLEVVLRWNLLRSFEKSKELKSDLQEISLQELYEFTEKAWSELFNEGPK